MKVVIGWLFNDDLRAKGQEPEKKKETEKSSLCNVKKMVEDGPNFCGLLRISEL